MELIHTVLGIVLLYGVPAWLVGRIFWDIYKYYYPSESDMLRWMLEDQEIEIRKRRLLALKRVFRVIRFHIHRIIHNLTKRSRRIRRHRIRPANLAHWNFIFWI